MSVPPFKDSREARKPSNPHVLPFETGLYDRDCQLGQLSVKYSKFMLYSVF